MAKVKHEGWKPGMCQIKLEVKTPTGSKIKVDMPAVPQMEGLCFMALCNGMDRIRKDPTVKEFFAHLHTDAKKLGLI